MKGLTLHFLEGPSIKKVGMKSVQISPQIVSEVNMLLKKSIVINTTDEEGEFISPIFLRSKSDGTNRVISILQTSTKLWNIATLKWT